MKYFMPDDGEVIERARALGDSHSHNTSDPEDYANYAAEYEYHYCDGWSCKWPQKVAVVCANGSVKTFLVEMEAVPSFSASEVSA